MLDGGGAVVSTIVFEYQFDKKGNWIVKKEFRKPTGSVRVANKPIGVFYRDILYQESSDRKLVGSLLSNIYLLTNSLPFTQTRQGCSASSPA